jgi:hypothetical protein
LEYLCINEWKNFDITIRFESSASTFPAKTGYNFKAASAYGFKRLWLQTLMASNAYGFKRLWLQTPMASPMPFLGGASW